MLLLINAEIMDIHEPHPTRIIHIMHVFVGMDT